MKLCAVALCAVLAACACKGGSRPGTGPGSGSGSGSGSGPGGDGDPAACDAVAAHLTELYRAEGERTAATADEIADNVAMALADCKAAPAKVAPCAARATAVAVLEGDCLPVIDDRGTEGERFLRK
jgi:hypothetical protein